MPAEDLLTSINAAVALVQHHCMQNMQIQYDVSSVHCADPVRNAYMISLKNHCAQSATFTSQLHTPNVHSAGFEPYKAWGAESAIFSSADFPASVKQVYTDEHAAITDRSH